MRLPAAVRGRLSDFVEGWKRERSLCVKYRGQGVQTSFYESTPSTRDPLGDKIPPGARGNSSHAGKDIPYASEERYNRGASRIPQGFTQTYSRYAKLQEGGVQ